MYYNQYCDSHNIKYMHSVSVDGVEGAWISAVATNDGLNWALFALYNRKHSTERHNMTQKSAAQDYTPK